MISLIQELWSISAGREVNVRLVLIRSRVCCVALVLVVGETFGVHPNVRACCATYSCSAVASSSNGRRFGIRWQL